ncbi:MAG: transcriptional regulator [Deltaproteobacteria bacterium]|nr:MAG: transcriptional regulator [Deltaproteobacteria bacterium]
MAIVHLLITLLEHFGLIVSATFLLLSWSAFRKLVLKETSLLDKSILILFFGAFGIVGTYAGTPMMGAIANLRAIGVITGGLFGGPLVGAGAGIIAGGHRFLIDMNGFTSVPCGLSTFLEGLAAGLLSLRLKEKVLNWRVAAFLGIVGESAHMLITMAIARPFAEAWALVQVVALPMILINSFGAGLFVEIIRFVLEDRQRRESLQARKALDIANRTVTYLKNGLTMESARETAQIIFDHLTVAAVSMTDETQILSFIGAGEDHHQAGMAFQTAATRKVIQTGKPVFLMGKEQIGCTDPHCPLESAIVAPLRKGKSIVGAIKFYGSKKIPLNKIDFQLALGLANLFSTQLELEDIHITSQLLARAEIKRLQSQINPHFLFNSLNTIVSLCRTNAEKARELILELSTYLRRNLRQNMGLIPVAQELQQVKSYLSIEQARFGDRIRVSIDMEEGCQDWPVPPLIIQPLVENAIKHGIYSREDGGSVLIGIARTNGDLSISVKDNGVGMNRDVVRSVFSKETADLGKVGGGIGLRNINQRLERVYGPQYRLRIRSSPQKGTSVRMKIPASSPVLETAAPSVAES